MKQTEKDYDKIFQKAIQQRKQGYDQANNNARAQYINKLGVQGSKSEILPDNMFIFGQTEVEDGG